MRDTKEEIYELISEAIASGNTEDLLRLQNKLLLLDRDTSIDESLMNSIREKTIGRKIKRVISEEDELDSTEYMKLISSLITHVIIESEQTGNSTDSYSIKEMYSLLGNYVNGNDSADKELKNFIIDRYSNLV